MSGMAAVQARISQIQSQFPAPVRAYAPVRAQGTAAAPGMQGGFASVLAASQAQLPPSLAASGTAGEDVVATAKQQLGVKYVWGGESMAEGGFDCSGLIQWSYKQHGIDLPRVSRDQAKMGTEVTAAQARPGDLVFFDRPGVDHIGMYAGNGQWVVAPKTGDVVKMQNVDLSKATTIRRILPDGAVPAAGMTAPVAAQRVAGGAGARFEGLFQDAGAKHGVSPALLRAVARAESGFDPKAGSPAGAQGLMQFMPGTARELGVDPWDPASAVDGAARLLKQHLGKFGSVPLALAAYNAGPGAVSKYGGIPPYKETQNYVGKIMTEFRQETA